MEEDTRDPRQIMRDAIVCLVADCGGIIITDIIQKLGKENISHSKDTISKELKKLVDDETLEKIRNGRKYKYYIAGTGYRSTYDPELADAISILKCNIEKVEKIIPNTEKNNRNILQSELNYSNRAIKNILNSHKKPEPDILDEDYFFNEIKKYDKYNDKIIKHTIASETKTYREIKKLRKERVKYAQQIQKTKSKKKRHELAKSLAESSYQIKRDCSFLRDTRDELPKMKMKFHGYLFKKIIWDLDESGRKNTTGEGFHNIVSDISVIVHKLNDELKPRNEQKHNNKLIIELNNKLFSLYSQFKEPIKLQSVRDEMKNTGHFFQDEVDDTINRFRFDSDILIKDEYVYSNMLHHPYCHLNIF